MPDDQRTQHILAHVPIVDLSDFEGRKQKIAGELRDAAVHTGEQFSPLPADVLQSSDLLPSLAALSPLPYHFDADEQQRMPQSHRLVTGWSWTDRKHWRLHNVFSVSLLKH